MLKRIFLKFKQLYTLSSSSRYLDSLRKKGVSIGEGCFVLDPIHCSIDDTRPSLVTIGRNCFFNSYFELHTHDWVNHVFLHKDLEFTNSSGPVRIGDNVAFARNVMVLKGVTIGDNCFIGTNSVVTHDIPSNSIAVGSPAKVVMSLDEYYQKRRKLCKSEAFEYARSILKRFNREPVPADFTEEFPFFVSGGEIDKYPQIPIKRQLGPIYEKYKTSHTAEYSSFENFIKAAFQDEA